MGGCITFRYVVKFYFSPLVLQPTPIAYQYNLHGCIFLCFARIL